ncbi:MAG: dihydrofolate reductase family protein [Flavobacterium sp.]
MRKVILQVWVTVDGFAADEKGSTAFFEDPKLNEELDKDTFEFIQERVDTVLLGANTYKMFAEYWPYQKNDTEVMAEDINTLPKIVFSKSLESAPWGDWEPAKVVSEDPVAYIKKLKQQSGKDIVIWGSLLLAQSLMKAGDVIDDYYINVCPQSLGKGKKLFADEVKLKLVESRSFDSGLVQLKYVPE